MTSIREGQDGLGLMPHSAGIKTFASDGRTYVLVSGSEERAVQIIDVTDPQFPTHVVSTGEGQGRFAAESSPEATFTADGRTYALLADSGGLQIIDVTDPQFPTHVAASSNSDGADRYYAPHFDVEIFAASGRTYALTSGFGDALQIINITDPAAPERLTSIGNGQDGFTGLSHPLDLETLTISGETYALVANDRYGVVQVLDITDPVAPMLVTSIWDGTGDISTFDASDRTYALVMSESVLQVINITDPVTSSTISGARTSARFYFGPGGSTGLGIFTADGRTYAMATPRHSQEVLFADITDVEAPEFLDPVRLESPRFFSIFSDPTDMELFTTHGRTYVLISGYSDFDSVGTLQTIDITRPRAPVLLATVLGGQDGFDVFRAPVDVEAFAADGHMYALVVDYGFGSEGSIHVIDITDPAEPLPVTTILGGQDSLNAMDNPVDVGIFVIDGVIYALVSNPDGSILQVVSLAEQSVAP